MLERKEIELAKEFYLKFHSGTPKQFNVSKRLDHFSCEFMEEESTWREGTTWMSGEAVKALFETCDPSLVDLSSWNEEWNDRN